MDVDKTDMPPLNLENTESKTQSEPAFYPNRVFINHLDSFNGKYIAEILSEKLFHDVPKNEIPGEGEEEGYEEGEESPRTIELMADFPSLRMTYDIVGTLRNKFSRPSTEVVTAVFDEENEEVLIQDILRCGFIVFDITNDPGEIPKVFTIINAIEAHLDKIEEATPKKFKTLEQRVFILISTIMTWAKTRPVDPEEPDVPFVETDYRKRKPHPNYKKHIELEKEVMAKGKKHKDKFLTYVIASGLTYGMDEEDLQFYFKLAWYNETDLPIMMNGNNTIPLINVKDLASVLYGIFEKLPKKPRYILAVEQTPCTQKQIVKTLAKNLGNTKIRFINKEESFTYPDMIQTVHERLNVNLKMEPNMIVSELDIPWQSDLNFCDNMPKMIREFKESRKLQPLNIMVHGPPAVGKTLYAKKIAQHYNIPYISIQSLMISTLEDLRADIMYGRDMIKMKHDKEKMREEAEDEDFEEEEEDDEDMESKVEELQAKLIEIEKAFEFSLEGVMPQHLLIQLLKEKLESNLCQNHGYVLDGYPETSEQAKVLFMFDNDGPTEEEEENLGEEDFEEIKKHILPHIIIALEASDEFLCNRVMEIPEKDIIGTNYNEESFVELLNKFRGNNTDDNTVLNLFDEREIHPYLINAETNDINQIFSLITGKMGPVKGYPLSPAEMELKRLQDEKDRLRVLEEEKKIKEEMERIAEEERNQNMEKWAELLSSLQQEEQQLLAAQCKPLREYLVKYIFPTLTKGLLETARIKPDDPIDFLAEFLFKENPEGRMFDPAYVAAADNMFKIIEDFQDRLGV